MHQIARKIWDLLNPTDRSTAVGLLVLMIIGMGMEMLGVGLVIPVITLLTQPDLSSYPALAPLLAMLGNPDRQWLIVGVMIGFVGIYLVKTLFVTAELWLRTKFIYNLEADLSQRLFEIYLRQPYTFHLQRNSAQLIRNAVNEIGMFNHTVLGPGMALIAEGLVLAGLCALLLVIEPLGVFIVATGLGGVAWGWHRLSRGRLTRWGNARQYHEGLRIQHLQEGLGGAKDVKLLGREEEFLAQYRKHNVESARMLQHQAVVRQLPRVGLEFLAVTGLAGLVVILLARGHELSAIVPTLGVFAAAAFRLMPSVIRVLGSIQALRFGTSVINTLHQEFQHTFSSNSTNETPPLPLRHTVTLDQVTFTYPGASQPSLENGSILIRRGETIGVIGPSGSGKSTLVDLLLGLLKPDSGHVQADGIDIEANLRLWQNQIGYVPQAIYLTDDTLKRNIAFGVPEAQIHEAAVWRAVNGAQLENFVQSLPAGLETLTGERGIRLSGGQRQRIGIARALYHDPAILVLDEATSSLDVSAERSVMEAIKSLHGAKTILIVAHRLSTVAHCDRIYRLQEGQVVEEGTPAQILPKRQMAR